MSDTSQQIVVLNPDSTEVVLKDIQGIYDSTAHLSHEFRQRQLTEEMRSTLCSLLEYTLDRVNKTLGYYGALGKEMERRNAELRRANQRVRELEKMLGSSLPLDGFGQQLSFLYEELDAFWDRRGFNHVSDVTFIRWGTVRVKYGFTLDHMPRFLSQTPGSDRAAHKEWLQGFVNAGYIIVKDDGGRENALLDCDHNRRLLIDLLTTRYPSMRIYKWENLPLHNCAEHPNGSHIFGLEVTIKDVKDIPNPVGQGGAVEGEGEQP